MKKNHLMGKTVSIGIILLFAGTCVIPSSIPSSPLLVNKVPHHENTVEASSQSTTDWWLMFHHDLYNSGYSESSAPDSNHTEWIFNSGQNEVFSSPVIMNDKIFFGSILGNLYCLNAKTGEKLWVSTINNGVISPAAIDGGRLYFGSTNYNVYCFDSDTGSEIWSFTTGYPVESPPKIWEGKVYVGSYDNNFYCLDADDGSKIWAFTTGYFIRSSPAIYDGMVYIFSDDGLLYCLDADNGTKIWSFDTNSFGIGVSSPVISDGYVYTCSFDNKTVYCLNAYTGAIVWQYITNAGVVATPAVFASNLIIHDYGGGSFGGKLYCLGKDTGDEIWIKDVGGSYASPIIADNKVYLHPGDHIIYCFDIETGNEIWTYPLMTTDNDIAIAKGALYTCSYSNNNEGLMYCFKDVLHVGGPGPNNYSKIQDAIDNASDGDTVFVFDDSSPYYEHLYVNKSIELTGENKLTTVIDGGGNNSVISLTQNASGTTVCGFTIQHGGNYHPTDAGIHIQSDSTICDNIIQQNAANGIYLQSSEGITLSGNTFLDNNQSAILLDTSHHTSVLTNTLSNNYIGIRLVYSRNNTITGNTVSNSSIGVFLEYTSDTNLIADNNVSSNGIGIEIHSASTNNTISGNTVSNNNDGIFLYDSSSKNLIKDNSVCQNEGVGIHLNTLDTNVLADNVVLFNTKGILVSFSSSIIIQGNSVCFNNLSGIEIISNSSDNLIVGNNISGNEDGIQLWRFSDNNEVINNTISANGRYGVYLHWADEPSIHNMFYHNNFIGNAQNAFDECNNEWDNWYYYSGHGNYWDDYTGTDYFYGVNQDKPGSDGIGDDPYEIPGGAAVDRYPYMKPSGWNENYPPIVADFNGSRYGKPGIRYSFFSQFWDPNDDKFYVMFDWGDGSYSAWEGPYSNADGQADHHAWSNGLYYVSVKAKDISGAESDWSAPIPLIIEDIAPHITIMKPDRALYIMNKRILPRFLRGPLIIGTIDITVNASDNTAGDSGIEKVEFYIDGKLKFSDTNAPYSYPWHKEKITVFKHRHIIKVVAVDHAGNTASDKIIVKKFF